MNSVITQTIAWRFKNSLSFFTKSTNGRNIFPWKPISVRSTNERKCDRCRNLLLGIWPLSTCQRKFMANVAKMCLRGSAWEHGRDCFENLIIYHHHHRHHHLDHSHFLFDLLLLFLVLISELCPNEMISRGRRVKKILFSLKWPRQFSFETLVMEVRIMFWEFR